jgi:hypothetical protein
MTYKIIRRFLPVAFLATALCGLVYLAVQQSLRQGANDPQIQMAEDMVVASGTVNINASLAPYMVSYDASGHPIGGNGMLDGSLANLPSGVFSYTAAHGEDRFTWQPRPGIRQAVVLVSIPSGGFVMAGRSLREVEVREDQAEHEAGAVWLAVIGGLLILEIFFAWIEVKRSRRS